MKYYAVKVGNNPGLFDNWAECQESIKGFSGAVYKSFNSKEEAEAFLSDRDIWGEQIAADIEQGYLVAFCDGSFDKELNRYSYGVIIIGGDHTETPLCGYASNPKYIVSNNIIGEIFGVINALDWAVSNGYEKIKIYHDYEGLSKWLSGEWNAGTDASKMYASLYHTKFEGVIDVVFEKVKGHSNNPYNDKADALAKSALVDRTRMAIQGDHWFVLPYFKESDFKALTELVSEAIPGVSIDKKEYGTKFVYRLEYEHKKVVVSLFKSKNQKVLIQGENSLLFQIVVSIVTELDGNAKIEPILSSAYRTTIDSKKIDTAFETIYPSFPADYPDNIKRLIRQALINLNYYVESEEYSQYAFPALRALEGHMKYLITKAGGTVGRWFSGFNKDAVTGDYIYTASLTDTRQKSQIEKCYNYYKAVRDTVFHFGDIMGSTDSTRMLETKAEADEIITKCFSLIGEL
mgnify:FL=1